MPTENTTANRGYSLPHGGNLTKDDVLRLVDAINQIDSDMATMLAGIVGYVSANSPVFSGTPTAPTAAAGNNTQQLATTAFVAAAIAVLSASVGSKLDHISVSQAVDLNQMETDVAALANGMVYSGDWDASAGNFPGGGSAKVGAFYTVSVAGTVDSVEFAVGDRLVATTGNASTTTYAANWTKLDATDAVTAIAGLTGNISQAALLAALMNGAVTTQVTPEDNDKVLMLDASDNDNLKHMLKSELGGSHVLLGAQVVANAASAVFTNVTGFDKYELHVISGTTVNPVDFAMRVSTDNALSFDTGFNYRNLRLYAQSSSPQATTPSTDSFFNFGLGGQTNAAQGGGAVVEIWGLNDASQQTQIGSRMFMRTTTDISMIFASGQHGQARAENAIQVITGNGPINAAIIKLYGVK